MVFTRIFVRIFHLETARRHQKPLKVFNNKTVNPTKVKLSTQGEKQSFPVKGCLVEIAMKWTSVTSAVNKCFHKLKKEVIMYASTL